MVVTDSMAFIPNGVRYLKRHSFANISEAWRGHNRDLSSGRLSLAFGPSLGRVPERNTHFENVGIAVIQLFQKKKLQENELHSLQEDIRHLNKECGPLIYDYYKDQLMKKGMVIIRETIKRETGFGVPDGGLRSSSRRKAGKNLLIRLGEQWDFFYQEILPSLHAILYPVKTNNYSIKQITLLEFRNTVLLKLPVAVALDGLADNEPVPPSIQQMLLVLQSVHETPCSDASLQLEKLVARVVKPYLGLLGIYNGNPEPDIRSNFKMPPQIYVLESSTSDKSVSEEDLTLPVDNRTKRHKLSPLIFNQRLSPKHSSVHNHFLTTVKEQDVIRRHSIDTT